MKQSFKLQFRNPHYKTVKDGGAKSVLCTIECSMYLPLPITKRIGKKYKEVSFSFTPAVSNVISSVAEIEVTGTSKCHPDDAFEFESGKHLSESRAKAKAYRVARNILADLVDDYINDHNDSVGKNIIPSPVTIAKSTCDKLSSYYEDELSHIAKLEGK